MGYDVILLDLDPDRNLKKLFSQDINDEDASIFIPQILNIASGGLTNDSYDCR